MLGFVSLWRIPMIKIDLEKNIAFIDVGGTPTHIEIQESIDALLEHPDHRDGMNEIWDFRTTSTTSFNENELKLLANFVRKRLPKLAKRVAYVFAKDVDYGVGRMWLAYAEMFGAEQERELFRNMEEAVEWLISA